MIFERLGGGNFISRYILHQHWYTCPVALQVRRNPQHGCFWLVSATSAPPFQPLRLQRNICHPVVNRFMRQIVPNVNRKHFFMNILGIESFSPPKKRRTIERCSSVLHPSSTVTILTTETNLWTWRMHICYLDCHDTRLLWYRVIYIYIYIYIASIKAVIFSFVTYLLTLPRI
jgi:hypothetical protein